MRYKHLSAGIVIGLLVASTLPVSAGNGDTMLVGERNTAQKGTVLVSARGARTLKLVNSNSDGDGFAYALDLDVPDGFPPLKVNSDVKVDLLNADLLDGIDSTAFAASGHDHDTTYLAVGAKAADSDLLDGMEAAAFATVAHAHAWTDLTSGVPAGLDDGDDDTLGALAGCAPGQVVMWDGSWACGNDLDTVLSEAEVIAAVTASGEFAAAAHDHDADYLGIAAKATDSDLLDGMDSIEFVAGADHTKATHDALDVDADTLDGVDSAGFSTTAHDHDSDYLAVGGTAVGADTVGGLAPSGLLRVAFGSTNDAADIDGNAVTASITAPAEGWLVMSGSVDVAGSGLGVEHTLCLLTIDGVSVGGTERTAAADDPGDVHTSNGEENCSTTGGSLVTPGSHTVALKLGGRTNQVFGQASVWALYIPFDGTGSTAPTASTWWLDDDGDGFGDPAASILAFSQPAGYVDNGLDCVDSGDVGGVPAVDINPAATETWYDGVDQDCDFWNDFDQDLDTYVADTFNFQAGGTSPNINDCVDDPGSGGATINPGMPEVCNGVDDNCDSSIDEGCPGGDTERCIR